MTVHQIKIKKILFFFLFVLLSSSTMEAQRTNGLYSGSKINKLSSEQLSVKRNGLYGHTTPGIISIMFSYLGPAFCFGDIGGSMQEQAFLGSNDYVMSNTRYLVAWGIKKVYPNNTGIKASVAFSTFAGTDENSRNWTRGYSFTSNLFEFLVQGEYMLLGGPYSKPLIPHSLYAFVGGGILNSDSKLKLNGVPGASRPQDNVRAQITAPVFPFGVGYQYRMTKKWTIGAEFGWHYILSDYVDGVHPTGSKNNDALAALTVTMTYKIYGVAANDDRCNCERDGVKKTRFHLSH